MNQNLKLGVIAVLLIFAQVLIVSCATQVKRNPGDIEISKTLPKIEYTVYFEEDNYYKTNSKNIADWLSIATKDAVKGSDENYEKLMKIKNNMSQAELEELGNYLQLDVSKTAQEIVENSGDVVLEKIK